jgi:hypothetical protein
MYQKRRKAMNNFKLSVTKVSMILAVITLCVMPVKVLGETLPKGVKQVWTSVEGNIIYYVKVGDKVKKGDPLFFVVCGDNDPELFFQIQHKIEYYRLLYLRRMKLIKTHAVSEEALDEAVFNLINSQDELALFISKLKQGFYEAPFDCEITKLLYPQKSGIGDGNPAINIKATDKDYKFEPPKPNQKLLELISLSNKTLKDRLKRVNINKLSQGKLYKNSID